MTFRANLVANYLGQGWSGLMGLAFVPIYIRYLGMESYGLIGVFALLQAGFALLDMGITPTLNREMSRFNAGARSPQSIRNLLRTLEMMGIGVAVLVSLLIWNVSAWLASGWLRAEMLSIEIVSQAIAIMGFVVTGRFLEGLYRGALLGLQQQVIFNVANALFATLRAVGAVAVLVWVSPTIQAYFAWQGFATVVSIIVLAALSYSQLPVASKPAKFSFQEVREVRRFVGGMMVTAFLSILLTQVDKLLLSRMLELEAFGYYTLATVVVSVIGLMIAPITQAAYPRFTELVTKGDQHRLSREYHLSAQLVTALIGSIALMLFFFPEDILIAWTGDPVIVRETAPLLRLLAVGTFLNGLMHVPYMLQLAHGWAGLAVKVNSVAVVLLIPTIIWAVPRYGAVGAAWAWIVLNAGYVLVGIQIMHLRLLPSSKWNWYWNDVLVPVSAATVVAAAFKVIFPQNQNTGMIVVWLVITGSAIASAALFASKELRIALVQGYEK